MKVCPPNPGQTLFNSNANQGLPGVYGIPEDLGHVRIKRKDKGFAPPATALCPDLALIGKEETHLGSGHGHAAGVRRCLVLAARMSGAPDE